MLARQARATAGVGAAGGCLSIAYSVGMDKPSPQRWSYPARCINHGLAVGNLLLALVWLAAGGLGLADFIRLLMGLAVVLLLAYSRWPIVPDDDDMNVAPAVVVWANEALCCGHMCYWGLLLALSQPTLQLAAALLGFLLIPPIAIFYLGGLSLMEYDRRRWR